MKKYLAQIQQKNPRNNLLVISAATFILLAIPLTVFLSKNSEEVTKNPKAATVRDQYTWPFAPTSIWNLPIGAGAQFVPAGIQQTYGNGGAMTTDDEFIGLNLNDPLKPLNGGTQVHVPSGMSHNGSWNGVTAFLQNDSIHVSQGQPLVLSPGGNPSWAYTYPTVDITSGFLNGDDASRQGAHGGSGLSSFGGTIRNGEMTSSAPLHHALKINLNSVRFISPASVNGMTGYRWPATHADGNALKPGHCDTYSGSVTALRMGALLALRPDANLSFIKSTQALKIARALQDYGGYVVDSTCWDVSALSVENGAAFGDGGTFNSDLQKIFMMLNVVDNWDQTKYQTVAQSNGQQGAGGGAPRVAWAPPIGASVDNPPTVSITNPTSGATIAAGTAVTVTVAAFDNDSTPVANVKISIDGSLVATGTSSPYTYSWNTTGLSGSHIITAVATDTANLVSPTATATVAINSPPPNATYLWCEAERLSLVAPMVSGTDAAASAGSYIYSPVTDVTTVPPTTTGSATYTFNINQAGVYTFWSRVKYLTDATTNSYFAQFDNSPSYIKVGNDNTFGIWQWINWHDGDISTTNPITVNLTTGAHTLKIIGREANTFIDKVLFTNDPTYTPTGTGGASSCSRTTKIGDLNGDGKVDILDISRILDKWGATNKPPEDLNQDGKVDIQDISIAIDHWG